MGSGTVPGDVMMAPSAQDQTSATPPLHTDVTHANRVRMSVPGLLALLLLFAIGALFAWVIA